MNRVALGASLLLLAGCPRGRPVTVDTHAILPSTAMQLAPCEGSASREGGARNVSLRADSVVDREGSPLLRITRNEVTDRAGRVRVARVGARSFRVEDGGATLTLEGDALLRADGLRATASAESGEVVLRNAAGEVARSPWTLRCEGSGRAAALLMLLVVDGLDRAQSDAPQGERVP